MNRKRSEDPLSIAKQRVKDKMEGDKRDDEFHRKRKLAALGLDTWMLEVNLAIDDLRAAVIELKGDSNGKTE